MPDIGSLPHICLSLCRSHSFFQNPGIPPLHHPLS
nr:MAG TPA: hypothetical protein [Caudoviricetes sp.]